MFSLKNEINIDLDQRSKQGEVWKILDEGLRIKLDEFLCGNRISFTLQGRNNQIYVGKNEKGESEFKSKKYILWTLNELSKIISEEFSKLNFSTIYDE